jgi:hypothetical protein
MLSPWPILVLVPWLWFVLLSVLCAPWKPSLLIIVCQSPGHTQLNTITRSMGKKKCLENMPQNWLPVMEKTLYLREGATKNEASLFCKERLSLLWDLLKTKALVIIITPLQSTLSLTFWLTFPYFLFLDKMTYLKTEILVGCQWLMLVTWLLERQRSGGSRFKGSLDK